MAAAGATGSIAGQIAKIAGPGAISTVIIEGQRHATLEHQLALLGCILAAAGGTVTATDSKVMKYLDKERVGIPEPFLNPSFIAWGRPSLVPSAV